ncbi:Hypothetical protein, putative [Bodo saltans]|uniref:Fibronectin type-III domain-containing protein n=1 Tax=Bodo saltans TaxID=75058 RepID=A0A0S4JE18_BODSA|nr:Hypothetical protein, putative [Bodo saltans]|eukprot:CUG86601.1 Hypothetical protein, putative [Bodo saltans]
MLIEAFAAPTVRLVDLFETWAVIRISAPPLWHLPGSKGNGLRPARYEIVLACLTLDPRTNKPAVPNRSVMVEYTRPPPPPRDKDTEEEEEGDRAIGGVDVLLTDMFPHGVYDLTVRGVTTNVDALRWQRESGQQQLGAAPPPPAPWIGASARMHIALLLRPSIMQGVVEPHAVNVMWSLGGWAVPQEFVSQQPTSTLTQASSSPMALGGVVATMPDIVSLYEVELFRSSTFDRNPQVERFGTTVVPGVSPLGGARRIPLRNLHETAGGMIILARVRTYRPGKNGEFPDHVPSHDVVGSHLPKARDHNNSNNKSGDANNDNVSGLYGEWSEFKRLVCLPDIRVRVLEIGSNSCCVSWADEEERGGEEEHNNNNPSHAAKATTVSGDLLSRGVTDCYVCCRRAPLKEVRQEATHVPLHECRHVQVEVRKQNRSGSDGALPSSSTTTTSNVMRLNSLAPSTVYNLTFSYRYKEGGETCKKSFRFRTRPAPLVDLRHSRIGSTFVLAALKMSTTVPLSTRAIDLLGGYSSGGVVFPHQIATTTGGDEETSVTPIYEDWDPTHCSRASLPTSNCHTATTPQHNGDLLLSAHLLTCFYQVQAVARGAVVANVLVLHSPTQNEGGDDAFGWWAKMMSTLLTASGGRSFLSSSNTTAASSQRQIVEGLMQPPPPPEVLHAILDPLPEGTAMVLRCRCGLMSFSALLSALQDVFESFDQNRSTSAVSTQPSEGELLDALSARCVYSSWSDAPLIDRPQAALSDMRREDSNTALVGGATPNNRSSSAVAVTELCAVSTLSGIDTIVEQRMPTSMTITFAHTTATTRALRSGGVGRGEEIPVEWLYVCILEGSEDEGKVFQRSWWQGHQKVVEGSATLEVSTTLISPTSAAPMLLDSHGPTTSSSPAGDAAAATSSEGLVHYCPWLRTKQDIQVLDTNDPFSRAERPVEVYRVPLHDVRMLRWDHLKSNTSYSVMWNAMDEAGVWLGGKSMVVETLPTPEVHIVAALKKLDWGSRLQHTIAAAAASEHQSLFESATYAPILDKDFFLYARNVIASKTGESAGPVVDPLMSEVEADQLLSLATGSNSANGTSATTTAASSPTLREWMKQRTQRGIQALRVEVDCVTTTEVVLRWRRPSSSTKASSDDADDGENFNSRKSIAMLPLEYRLRVSWVPLPHLAIEQRKATAATAGSTSSTHHASSQLSENENFRDYLFRCDGRCNIVRLSELSPAVLHTATLSVFDKELNRWTPWSSPCTFSVTSRLEMQLSSITASGFVVQWQKKHANVDPRVLLNPVTPESYEVSVLRCTWEALGRAAGEHDQVQNNDKATTSSTTAKVLPSSDGAGDTSVALQMISTVAGAREKDTSFATVKLSDSATNNNNAKNATNGAPKDSHLEKMHWALRHHPTLWRFTDVAASTVAADHHYSSAPHNCSEQDDAVMTFIIPAPATSVRVPTVAHGVYRVKVRPHYAHASTGPWSDVSFLYSYPLAMRVTHVSQRRCAFEWNCSPEQSEHADGLRGLSGDAMPRSRRVVVLVDELAQTNNNNNNTTTALSSPLSTSSSSSSAVAEIRAPPLVLSTRHLDVASICVDDYDGNPNEGSDALFLSPRTQQAKKQNRSQTQQQQPLQALTTTGVKVCSDLLPDRLYRLRGVVVTTTLPIVIAPTLPTKTSTGKPLSDFEQQQATCEMGGAAGCTEHTNSESALAAAVGPKRLMASVIAMRMAKAFAKFPTALLKSSSLSSAATESSHETSVSATPQKSLWASAARKTLDAINNNRRRRSSSTTAVDGGLVLTLMGLDSPLTVQVNTLPLISPLTVVSVGPTDAVVQWSRLLHSAKLESTASATQRNHSTTSDENVIVDNKEVFQKEVYTIVVWDVTGSGEVLPACAATSAPKKSHSAGFLPRQQHCRTFQLHHAPIAFMDTVTPTRPQQQQQQHAATDDSKVPLLTKRIVGLSNGREYVAVVVPFSVNAARGGGGHRSLGNTADDNEGGYPIEALEREYDNNINNINEPSPLPTSVGPYVSFATMSSLKVFWELQPHNQNCLRVVVSRCWISHYEQQHSVAAASTKQQRQMQQPRQAGTPHSTNAAAEGIPATVEPHSVHGCFAMPRGHDVKFVDCDFPTEISVTIRRKISAAPMKTLSSATAETHRDDDDDDSGGIAVSASNHSTLSAVNSTRQVREERNVDTNDSVTSPASPLDQHQQLPQGSSSAATTYRFRRSGANESVVELFPPATRGLSSWHPEEDASSGQWGNGGGVRVVIKARQRDYNGEWEGGDWVRATIVL